MNARIERRQPFAPKFDFHLQLAVIGLRLGLELLAYTLSKEFGWCEHFIFIAVFFLLRIALRRCRGVSFY